jgi:hypothetical protein
LTGIANRAGGAVGTCKGRRPGNRRAVGEALAAAARLQVDGGDAKTVQGNQLAVELNLELGPAGIAGIEFAVAIGIELARKNRTAGISGILATGISKYRKLHHKPWRLIYRIIDADVIVYCVVDGRRDIQSFLERRLLRCVN